MLMYIITLSLYIFCGVFRAVSPAGIDSRVPAAVLRNWASMGPAEKLPYLLDAGELSELVNEFVALGASDSSACIVASKFRDALQDFQSPHQVDVFLSKCDTNGDLEVCFDEYATCRGDFDRNGNAYIVNEYEVREKSLLDSLRFDPSQRVEELVVGPDGIIIDN
jgi:hypothetical protein